MQTSSSPLCALCAGLLAVLGAVCFPLTGSGGAEPALAELEQQFRTLPMEARRLTGPLFWLHGDESRQRLEQFVGKVAEGGNGSFTVESRPHSDWLGPGWFRDVGICLEAAKRYDLKLWIFDEKWWPSQAVGGRVPPRYAAKQLSASSVEAEGPGEFAAEGYGGPRYIAAVAGRVAADGAIQADSLVDLAPSIRGGKLAWRVPVGRWKVMKFTHRQAPGLGQGGGTQLSVDGASRDCVEWFLQTVYQPHYDRFQSEFGRTISGFFYDEPETRGDWGTELDRVLAERRVDWKKAYVAYKFRLAGEEQAAARYQYLDARAEAWGRTMYGGMSQWCRRHGILSHGHFMEHANLYLHPDFCAGDLMQLQKYSDQGALDAVFSQFKPGQRAAYDTPCWQTPKLASSVTHAYGKADDVTMVEIFGARGQDLTYPEMKWWADHMHVCGVNFLIPHSFNPRAPYDTDCPPYFYMEQYEPRWPLYRVFADYTCRLSLMLTGGRHVAPVALLFLGQSAQVGRHIKPEQISESLQDALYDCDWLPFEVFENDCQLAEKEIRLRDEAYQVLIVPPVEVIPYAALAKAKDFFDRGGVVLAHGFLPEKSATIGRTSADIAGLTAAIWGAAQPGLAPCKTSPAGGRSYLLPEKPTPEQIQRVLAGDAGIHPALECVAGRTDHWLHVLHRVRAGRDLFFIANQNHLGQPRSFRFRISAPGVPECWDPLRGEITRVKAKRVIRDGGSGISGRGSGTFNAGLRIPCFAGDWGLGISGRRSGTPVPGSASGCTLVDLTLAPSESVLLVFQPESRRLPERPGPGLEPKGEPIALVREALAPPAAPEPLADGPSRPVTRSPARADPFLGRCQIPAEVDLSRSAVYLELDQVAPEAAARVTVNGQYAGGIISEPLRLEIARYLKPGANTVRIEPFAPKSAKLVVY
ncbi:MAG: glycosyl hydrolase [Thermoguttaceae bacterium]|jgi:hypothetical protein